MLFRSDGEFVWEPLFVYHGFRFMEISGLDYEPAADDFTGNNDLVDAYDNVVSIVKRETDTRYRVTRDLEYYASAKTSSCVAFGISS